jgi:hypothetical protein
MANTYDPQWDRVVRAIRDHYGMYSKIRENNIRKGVQSLENVALLGHWKNTFQRRRT